MKGKEESIGVGIIARNVENTIESCLESFLKHVDQCVVIYAGESTDKTVELVEKLKKKYKHLETHAFSWIDDFSAARNYSFSFLETDWLMWVDADDKVLKPENLRGLVEKLPENTGGVWFPYEYAVDEFGNITTLYERERLLRASCGWLWRGRLHETVAPLSDCKYVKTDEVIVQHRHLAGTDRGERNFRILELMLKADPNDRRLWLYMGHQNYASRNLGKAAEWYMKFGTDDKAVAVERYQALCYASKALRGIQDEQCSDVAVMAMTLFPEFRDAYLDLAQACLFTGDLNKAIHWAKISEKKELIKDPPHIIFISPLDYSFNKYILLAEAYTRKGDYAEALKHASQAYLLRPTPELEEQRKELMSAERKQQVIKGIQGVAVELLERQELHKLALLPNIVPSWFKDLPDFRILQTGVAEYTQGIGNKPVVVGNKDTKSVVVNVGNATHLPELLEKMDKQYERVTVVSPRPSSKIPLSTILSKYDMEVLVANADRHILNLTVDEHKIQCDYENRYPKGLRIRMYLGQGLEYWSPKTIMKQGCGGSETSAAWLCREFAKEDHVPFIYAMADEVWDGVTYRHFKKYQPANVPCNLFISSRVPSLFNEDIQAKQKWLWFHDIHCGESFTPDIAERVDVIVALSHWHVEHLQRVYPFLQGCEVINIDGQEKSYDDLWTGGKFFKEAKITRKPKMAIIGDATRTDMFKQIDITKKVPDRFIWLSSPDRGLEEVLKLWKPLRKKLPKAELKIFYGWEYFDSSLWLPAQREMKERLRELLKQDGVEWCGRVGQEELAQELGKASALIYPPHEFRETYGIAFLEAQAAGVIVFYRQNGALGETIADRGVPLATNLSQEEVVDKVVATLHNSELCATIRKRAREYGLSRDWSVQSEKFLELYKQLEEGKNESER